MHELESGNFLKTTSDTVTEKSLLQAEIVRLRKKIKMMEEEVIAIRTSATYQQIVAITDWHAYFQKTKQQLQEDLKQLEQTLAEEGNTQSAGLV